MAGDNTPGDFSEPGGNGRIQARGGSLHRGGITDILCADRREVRIPSMLPGMRQGLNACHERPHPERLRSVGWISPPIVWWRKFL